MDLLVIEIDLTSLPGSLLIFIDTVDIFNAVAQKSTNLYLTQQKRNVIGNRIGPLPLPDLTSAGADYLT